MEIDTASLLHKAGRIAGSVTSILQYPVVKAQAQRVMTITGRASLLTSAEYRHGYAEALLEKLEARRIYVEKDERDCDHVRAWSVHRFDSIDDYNDWVEEVMDNREGPVWINAITKEYYETFNVPEPRDYIMEAHEDGRVNPEY